MLTLWQADTVLAAGRDPLRTHTVVMLGAAVHAWAQDSGRSGREVAVAPLARLLTLLQEPDALLADCPAPAGMGQAERDLLRVKPDLRSVAQHAAQDVPRAHLEAARNPAATITDRAAVIRAARWDDWED